MPYSQKNIISPARDTANVPRQRLGLIGKSISPSETGADSVSPSKTGAAVAVLTESESQPRVAEMQSDVFCFLFFFLSLLSYASARAFDDNGPVYDSPTALHHSTRTRSRGNRIGSGHREWESRTGRPTPLLARRSERAVADVSKLKWLNRFCHETQPRRAEMQSEPVFRFLFPLLSYASARVGHVSSPVDDPPTDLHHHSTTSRNNGNRIGSGHRDMENRTGHPTPLLARNTL